MSIQKRLTAAVLFLCIVVPVSAQEHQRLSLETMHDPTLYEAFSVPRVWWLEDNSAVMYDTRLPDSVRTLERLDPVTGKRTPFVDREKAAASFRALFTNGNPPRFNPVPQAISSDGRYGLYLINGDIFVLSFPTATFKRLTNTPEKEKSALFSPDGTKIAFVRGTDLYVVDIASGTEQRLTTDGTETRLNGTLSWVYWEEIFGRRDIGYWWSPDSKAIAYLQSDESQVSVQHYVDISPWTPTVTTQRYPKVGEKNPDVRVGIVELGSAKTTWADIAPSSYEYVIRVDWLPDNKSVCVRTLNRLQTDLAFRFVDRATGASRLITTDSDSGWVNMSDDLYFLNDGKHFVMWSERDGYGHLYRFRMDGTLENQITKGPWGTCSVGGGAYWTSQVVAGIDEKNDWIYFAAREKSPIEKQLYRIHLNGNGMQRLTKEDGTHSITMSPNARYYFDRFSSVTTPPSLALYAASGKRMQTLAEPRWGGYKTYDVQTPELMWVPARDGFQLPASLTKPHDFDPSKKYPVIVEVYGGPSAPTVANSFSYSAISENVLANEGYLTFKVDNRASTGISKKLENLLLYRALGEVELNDLVDAVRWLKKQPFIDSTRFGITGWSGGGSNTLLGMTRSTEFKAGVDGAGVTDFRFYDSKWGEAMMKTEKENLKGYEEYSLLRYAKDLHGKLMIIHGTHDDNVHIQNSWRFINELIKADKLFELMIYPMRKHGVGDPAGAEHLNHVMLDFWKRNL